MLKGIVIMGGGNLTNDVKEAIRICLRRNTDQKPDLKAIATAFETIHKTVWLIYKKMKEIELFSTTSTRDTPGRPPSLSREIEEAVGYLIAKVPYLYQDEIVDFIRNGYSIEVYQFTVSRLLKRMNTTRKRLAVIAKERNHILREDY
jgi:hypothetical protein